MSTGTDNYYALLGISGNASSEEIKKAYRKLCLKYHPDKTSDKIHHDLFIKIREAYDVLKAPDTRRSYDVSHKINRSSGHTTFTHTYSSSTANSSSHFTDRERPGYYNFYKYFYSHKSDSYEEQLKNERQRAKEADILAKQRQEQIFKKKREDIIRKEREELLKKEKEKARRNSQKGSNDYDSTYSDRKRDAYRKQWEPSFNPLDPEDELSDLNTPKKSPADYYAYSSPLSPHNPSFKGSDSNNPIVLDEEESDAASGSFSNGSSVESNSVNKERESFKSAESKSKDEFVSAGTNSSESARSSIKVETVQDDDVKYKEADDMFNFDVNIRPRQEKSKMYQRRKSTSPKRRSAFVHTSNEKSDSGVSTPQNKAKKFKASNNDDFGFKEMKEMLGTDIDDVNFEDMFKSLPEEHSQDDKIRTADADMNIRASKRAKLSEYTDGTSKADTLSIPVNRKTFISNPLISNLREYKDKPKPFSVFDLHASPKVLSCEPPAPPPSLLENGVTEQQWLSYVKSIKKYQKDFLKFKRLIVQYQYERLSKDEEHFSLVNSDPSCFEVYQKALERDDEVMHKFSDSLKVFTNTMNIYKQNCNWVKIARDNGIWPK